MELRNPIVFIHVLAVTLLLYEHALLNRCRMLDSPSDFLRGHKVSIRSRIFVASSQMVPSCV